MCGINGFNWEDPDLLKKMNSTIAHRGPDDEGIFVSTVSLGNTRLAIIDLSPAAHQPMHNEDRTLWITYNGEIYNFGEIREHLTHHRFISGSDTEVILHCYEEYGMNFLNRLNGMFAFALYDVKKNRLILARDRFGVKPLYYYVNDEALIFSSEIKGILTHPIRRVPNDRVIFDYLIHSLVDHTEETFLENIYRVMPGCYLIYDVPTKEITKKRWYSLGKRNTDAKKMKDSFFRSVKYRLVSDVPVGSCLSGGIDSTSIVCAMREISPGSDIKTFSAIFPGKSIDESEYIKEVVDKTHVSSYVVSPTVETLLQDLSDLVYTQEEPFLGTSMYAQYTVMRLAHEKGMKVLLDGQGGDELLAGYSFYYTPYFLELLSTFKWGLLLSEILPFLKAHDLVTIVATLTGPLRSFLRNHLSLAQWVNKDFYRSYKRKRVINYFFSEVLVESLTYSTIPALLRYEDKNAMRWSVETRLPFLDYLFAEEALSLPPEVKIRGGFTKYIFREAMNAVIPERVNRRTDKIGFATPEWEWLTSSELLWMVGDIVNSNSFRQRKYWDWKRVKRDFGDFQKKKKYRGHTLWKWVNLELWLRMFVDSQQDSLD